MSRNKTLIYSDALKTVGEEIKQLDFKNDANGLQEKEDTPRLAIVCHTLLPPFALRKTRKIRRVHQLRRDTAAHSPSRDGAAY